MVYSGHKKAKTIIKKTVLLKNYILVKNKIKYFNIL